MGKIAKHIELNGRERKKEPSNERGGGTHRPT